MKEKENEEFIENKSFIITFDHWGVHECPHPVMCDFCKEEEAAWWCEWLVTGYCEQCMEEQKAEYEKSAQSNY